MTDYLSLHRELYDALASEYQSRRLKYADHQREVLKPFIKEVLQRNPSGPRILEIGCGVGLDAGIMKEVGLNVEAIELSELMATYARQNVSGLKVAIGDFLETEFDGSFDGIYMSALLHLFPKKDAGRVLEKTHSLLNPNGVCFISTTVSTVSEEGLEAKQGFNTSHQRYRKHWTQEELTQALEDAGFHTIIWFDDEDPLFPRRWMNVLVEK